MANKEESLDAPAGKGEATEEAVPAVRYAVLVGTNTPKDGGVKVDMDLLMAVSVFARAAADCHATSASPDGNMQLHIPVSTHETLETLSELLVHVTPKTPVFPRPIMAGETTLVETLRFYYPSVSDKPVQLAEGVSVIWGKGTRSDKRRFSDLVQLVSFMGIDVLINYMTSLVAVLTDRFMYDAVWMYKPFMSLETDCAEVLANQDRYKQEYTAKNSTAVTAATQPVNKGRGRGRKRGRDE